MELFPDVPTDLECGPIRLRFDGIVRLNSLPELVPFYHFEISTEDRGIVGHINFRVGDTRHIRLCVGHIGYQLEPKHRGQAFSYYACLALSPFILRHYDDVILTTDPENSASIRTIERLGARFLEQIVVPKDDPAYLGGARLKRRYTWMPRELDFD